MIPFRMNPLGISVSEVLPLTLTAQQAGSTVKLNATGSPTVSGLHFRREKSGLWLPYTIGDTITLTNVGDSVQFWNSTDALSSNTTDYVQFALSGQILAKGNCASMLNYADFVRYRGLTNLFRDCIGLLSAPEMPFNRSHIILRFFRISRQAAPG